MLSRLGLLGFFCLSIFITLSCSSEKNSYANISPPIPVNAFEVVPVTVPVTLDCYGFVESSHSVEIRPRVEGYLDKIGYEDGQLVQEGQVLFSLEKDQYRARVDQFVAEVNKGQSRLDNAQNALKRLLSVADKRAVSKQQLDDALHEVKQSEALLQEAQAQLKVYQLQLGYTDVVSPVTGYADISTYRKGAFITPAADCLLTTVSQIDPAWVYFPISDNKFRELRDSVIQNHEDHFVEAFFSNGIEHSCRGSIDFQSPVYDKMTATLKLRAVFPNKDGKLRPGQFLRLKMYAGVKHDVLSIPIRAIMQSKEGPYVFCVDEANKVITKKITVSDWNSDLQEVEGLKSGDRVIVDGMNKVRVGQEVTISSIYSSKSASRN